MPSLYSFVAPPPADGDLTALVAEAEAALDRFTHAFNARDTNAMDQALRFPHVMLSGADVLLWNEPGQHPRDFFETLHAAGWRRTRYVSKTAVHVAQDKVHFVVAYTRHGPEDEVISSHVNVWVVTKSHGDWRISLRSY